MTPKQHDDMLIDEHWLSSLGWVAIGNTWYPPETSHPRQYTMPIVLWCRVDGTIRLGGGNEWRSENDAKRDQLRRLCGALGITMDTPFLCHYCGKEFKENEAFSLPGSGDFLFCSNECCGEWVDHQLEAFYEP